MAHMQEYLVKGVVVHKEGSRDAFDKISDLVTEWERATYPNMSHLQMHKSVKHSGDRLKLICHLNMSNVVEGDRVCDFKLIAASKDGLESAMISKNVCLSHSCQNPDFQTTKGGPTGKFTKKKDFNAAAASSGAEGESAYLIGKKRKLEQQQDNYKDAWKLINSEKMFAENCYHEKAGYLEEIGIYEASDLKDLESEHIETLAALLKEIPRKRWTRLLTGPI
mmetsp:Transcript_27977/g.52185  ORF Transcript_27977/g.52185 Transcript_27977/m.52185 type:complete len:222 (+) Transcript_27977:50-715(+)